MKNKYEHTRITSVTKDLLKQKQGNIERFIGKKVPLTVIIEKMASRPLYLEDSELRKLKKWRRFR